MMNVRILALVPWLGLGKGVNQSAQRKNKAETVRICKLHTKRPLFKPRYKHNLTLL